MEKIEAIKAQIEAAKKILLDAEAAIEQGNTAQAIGELHIFARKIGATTSVAQQVANELANGA